MVASQNQSGGLNSHFLFRIKNNEVIFLLNKGQIFIYWKKIKQNDWASVAADQVLNHYATL